MYLGVKRGLIELSSKPTVQQEMNISFKHAIYIFERGEEFEFGEFLSFHIN
jgi:hypothetical protein